VVALIVIGQMIGDAVSPKPADTSGDSSGEFLRAKGGDQIKNGRTFEAAYTFRVDESRSARFTIKGRYGAYDSVRTADAGETLIFAQSTGTVMIENLSKDREIGSREMNHLVQAYLPFDACVLSDIFTDTAEDFGIKGGIRCSVKVLDISTPGLDPGEKVTLDFNNVDSAGEMPVVRRVTSVAESDGSAYVQAIIDSPLVAGDSLNAKLGSGQVCSYSNGDRDYESGERVTYWSEDPEVNSCSTDQNAKVK